MKTNVTVQANGREMLVATAEKAVKEDMKMRGLKQSAMATLEIYLKPVEGECFYVATDKEGTEIDGKVEL